MSDTVEARETWGEWMQRMKEQQKALKHQTMEEITWIVAFRDKNTHQIVGPLWFHEQKTKPTRWAQNRCYDNCQYAVMAGQGYGYDKGVPDSVLQRQEWHDKPHPDECLCDECAAFRYAVTGEAD